MSGDSFNAGLVARMTKRGLSWDACGCGRHRGVNKRFAGYTRTERYWLEQTGLTGEVENGCPVISGLILRYSFRCQHGHRHEAAEISFLCPFGLEPTRVRHHGWLPDDNDNGFRVPHCEGPLRPDGSYRLVPLDTIRPLPVRELPGRQTCPDTRPSMAAAND